jgi:hypothetical protein
MEKIVKSLNWVLELLKNITPDYHATKGERVFKGEWYKFINVSFGRSKAEPDRMTFPEYITQKCPCWNDPCDGEGCNGTVEEFNEACIKDEPLQKDLKRNLGEKVYQSWIDFVTVEYKTFRNIEKIELIELPQKEE